MRVVFVDFDDCIYLHKEHWSKDKDFDIQLEYGLFLYRTYNPELLNKRLLDRLRAYAKYYEDNQMNMKIIMLTTCGTSSYFDKKRDFINKYCSDIFDESYAVSRSEDKIKFIIKMLKEIDSHTKETISAMVIDDNIFTLAEAQEYKMDAYTPMYFSEVFEV